MQILLTARAQVRTAADLELKILVNCVVSDNCDQWPPACFLSKLNHAAESQSALDKLYPWNTVGQGDLCVGRLDTHACTQHAVVVAWRWLSTYASEVGRHWWFWLIKWVCSDSVSPCWFFLHALCTILFMHAVFSCFTKLTHSCIQHSLNCTFLFSE